MTIPALLLAGAIVGTVIGLTLGHRKWGCAALWIVPLAMVAYIAIWQHLHPEAIRSTSGLDFLFGPLWPSLGALAGYIVGALLRLSGRWDWDDE